MKRDQIATIIFCTILIFSIYTIPNQIGDAYAHRNSAHSSCWNNAWSIPPLIISGVIVGLQLIALLLAFWTSGASLSWLQPLEIVGWIAKVAATGSQFLFVSLCGPQIIAPPSAVAGKSHLDCTSDEGFEFDRIENSVQKVSGLKFVDTTSHQINGTDGISKDLPNTLQITSIWVMFWAYILLVFEYVLDIALSFIPTPGKKEVAKVFDKTAKPVKKEVAKLVGKFFLGVGFAAGLGTAAGQFFDVLGFAEIAIPNQIIKDNSTDAISLHPLIKVENTVKGPETKKFSLGKNELKYFTQKVVFSNTDEDKFPLNVYDNEPPSINFGDDRYITLEANTHYGFNVNSKSLPLLQNGINVSDNCDPTPQLEYIGSPFFLVSSIKKDQYAQWVSQDTAPENGYWALTQLDLARGLDSELSGLNSPDSFMDTRTAQINPSQQVNFTQATEEFSTTRHLLVKVANSEINKLIDKQKEQSELPPTADVTTGGDLIDFVTDDKISIVGVSQESKIISNIPVEKESLIANALPQDTVLDLLQISSDDFEKGSQAIRDSSSELLVGLNRDNSLGSEVAEPNVFVDFQFVTIEDTIAPNILITEDLALEVNSTNPSTTDGTIVDKEGGGCSGVDQDIICALKIRPPAVFDIADPFPILYENFTQNGEFSEVESDLFGDFPLGVSTIGWKAVDFSGNGDNTNDIVTQFVNLKLNGTNIISSVFDVNATVFSTVPAQITLIANNTDQDPLKFLIEDNPSKGILDTPIDAVFLTKFQKIGSVSKLKGITNEGSNDEIFFTDSSHERVLKINSENENLIESFVGPQLGTPIGISRSGVDWHQFIISDWTQNKIIQTTDDGTVLQTFDVGGLFEKPEYLSVDKITNDIFVTDSSNGTISILSDFEIFKQPEGIEVDINSDTIYVVDELDADVKVFDSTGISMGRFGSEHLTSPSDVTVDSLGNIYVLDKGDNSIKNFTPSHSLAVEFSSMTFSHSFFNSPEGITIRGTDIFVADTQNHQVKKISSFNPRIEEFYNNATIWVQSGTGISINQGKEVAEFQNIQSGSGEPIKQIFQDLNKTLNDSWSAEFQIRSGVLKNNANAFIWLLTNSTAHPQNVTSQNALGVVYDDQELKIYERYGNSSTTSAGIPLIPSQKDYFVSFDKVGLTQASMVIYTDNAKTTQLTNGNVTHVISDEISELHVLQHSNDIVDGGDKVDLEIDTTMINPLLSWLGKCDSGPNCNAGISDQFSCTDTTCFGSGAGPINGQFDLPRGVSANSTHLFVADENNNRVQIFDTSGNHLSNLNVIFPTDVEFIDAFKRTVVTSANEHVKIFKKNGDIIEFGEPGPELGNFTSISSLGTDNSGNIYVTDNIKNTVQKFDKDGGFIEEWKSSINSRFDNFLERFNLYLPGIQAGALDTRDGKVVIGDWSPENERIIVANSTGGKLVQHNVSQITQNPHSLTVNDKNEIFVSDPPTKTLVVLNKISGEHLRNISTLNISGQNITPTGITANNLLNLGEKIYVFDDESKKIFSIIEGPTTATEVFNAKDLFVNLNDIAVNNTHVFALDLSQNQSSIVQIRWDKGIQDEVPINNNVTGVSLGTNGDSNLLFFTTAGSNNELISHNRTDDSITTIDLASLNITPSGITTIPKVSTLVDIPIENVDEPRGLAFAPNNNALYVSDFSKSEIQVFNATTFDLIESISDEELSLPTDLLFGPNGTLFVASYGNDAILEFNITNNNSVERFALQSEGISYPVGLAMSHDSKELYVSSSENDEITRHSLFDVSETLQGNYTDPDTNEIVFFSYDIVSQIKGMFLGTLVNSTNSETLANVQDIAMGPDNRLYAASFDSNQILSWDLDGTFRGVFGDASEMDSSLNGPSGIAFSPDGGSMFVSSAKNNQVLEFDVDKGKFIGIFSDETTKVPDALVFEPDGNLFVSSRGSGEVLEYGKLETKFYVSDWSDTNNYRILGISDNGNITLNQNIDHLNLIDPKNIVADNSAKLWIADAGSPSRLVQINPVSNIELTNIDISNLVEVPAPEVTLVPNSEPPIYVDDMGNNFTSIPNELTTTITPKGLSIDKNDQLYVTDWNNHRIIQLDQDGTFSGQIRVNSTFSEPMDIAVNQTDSGKLSDIWVFDSNFNELNISKLISLDVEKQFKKIEFADDLSPLLRGLTSRDGNMITTPSNSGSMFVINSTLGAHFDSKHFIIPMGIDLGENSTYVSDWKEKRIVKLDKSANFEREFDFKNVGFPTPELQDLEVSENKELFWITEPRRAVIDQINFTGTITKYISIGDKYVVMSGVDSDLDDNFFVASTNDTSIKKFDIRGTLLGNTKVVLNGGSMEDVAVGTSDSESVFLAISGPINSIIKYNSTDLSKQDELILNFMPSSIAVDNNKNIYVSNSTLKVTKFDQNFGLVGSFDIDLSTNGQITDMVIDSDNNLYASDKTNHRVYKYDLISGNEVGWLGKCDTTSSEENCIIDSLHSKGFTCKDIGPDMCSSDSTTSPNNGKSYGRDVGQFFEPNDLAIDGLDNIYVSDVKLSRTQIDEGFSGNFTDDTFNAPRVQKFTKEGFYVNQVISDLDNALVQGNFEWIKAIAYGKNNFYVADVDKLHVFDVNPFRNITFDPLTGNSTAEITYESFIDIVNDTDIFLYSAFDGFDKSQNIGKVNIAITDPDPDGDGIFGDIDLSSEFSDEFESTIDGTKGNIVDRGDQTLLVREARDSKKGIYIQADIRQTGKEAMVSLCENIAEIELNPGNRLIVTCNLGANNVVEGIELEILRGELSGIFYDGQGRESTFKILADNTIFFSQDPFEFISGEKNLDTITQTVRFNDKTHEYEVPPNTTVRVDTASPVLPEDNCTVPLVLETESIHGVTWSGVLDAESNMGLTGQFEKISAFLGFNATEVDNGNPQETDNEDTLVTHNATALFRFGNSSIPFENQVRFFTVDKIGNNATCVNSVFVKDSVGPILEFGPEFAIDSDGLRIENVSGRFSETGRVFWDDPKVFDLPDVYNGARLEVNNSTSECSQTSGSSFKISPILNETTSLDAFVTCNGKDLADNWNEQTFGFNVRITPHPDGLRIKDVIAGDKPGLHSPDAGLTIGDTVWVEFTMPTNQPDVSSKTDLEEIFDLPNGDFGHNVTGKWMTPSNLLITVHDISFPPIDLFENITVFDLKFNPKLTSSGGLLNSSGTLGDLNPIILSGSFSKPIPPIISEFIANDPVLNTDDIENDLGYSEGDTFTIRFSEPTDAPFGKKLNKKQINSLFSFSQELGEEYSGIWQNPSTLLITVDAVLIDEPSWLPTLGTSTATVIGDITNQAKTSENSGSTSPPLSGTFGTYYSIMDINDNGAMTQTLPSGITVGISFPNGTTIGMDNGDLEARQIIISEILEITISNSTRDCDLGCDVTFWIHDSDFKQHGVSLDDLRILHDVNDNGFVERDEVLIPEIKEIQYNLFSVSAKIFSFSSIALGAERNAGGGSGDTTAPEFQDTKISGGGSFKDLIIDDVKFDNNEGTLLAQTGEEFTITVTMYENSGIQSLQHVSLYMNLLGFDNMVHQSDTYIRWDKGLPVSFNDPNGYFLDAYVELFEVGDKIQAVFTFTFAKPMETSDVIIRAWDIHRNSADVNFRDLLSVTGDIITYLPEFQPSNYTGILDGEILNGSGNYTSVFPEGFIKKWVGYSSETISDKELLTHLGLEGDYIPQWFKNTTAKWFMEDKISEQEFVDALKYMANNRILFAE